MDDATIAEATRQLREALTCDTLRPDDVAQLRAILEVPAESVARIRAYYADRDRADRTPREFLYLHLGILDARARLRALTEIQLVVTEKKEPGA